MSIKYQNMDEVPSEVLSSRLMELSDAVVAGRGAIAREFTMRVPAEVDRDADLVLAAAALRIQELETKLKKEH